ncbi:unnamed protein product [Calypogeia fissa]
MANFSAVIGDQYVVPHETQLTIQKKEMSLHDGNFTITDAKGKSLFHLTDKTVSLHDKKTLYDAENKPVVSLQKKTFTMHNTFEVYAGDTDHKLFSLKKANIIGGVETYEVFVEGSPGNKADYVVKGNFAERDYNIEKGDFIAADIDKKHSFFGGGKHKYGVKVKSGVDQAFVAAVVVIVDSIHTEEKGDSDSD